MGMMAEILTLGVQHREKPDLSAEMSPICSDGAQRLGGCVEQDLVDKAIAAISSGTVKTTWKYCVSSSSSRRASIHSARASH
jgi:hypothetical protein